MYLSIADFDESILLLNWWLRIGKMSLKVPSVVFHSRVPSPNLSRPHSRSSPKSLSEVRSRTRKRSNTVDFGFLSPDFASVSFFCLMKTNFISESWTQLFCFLTIFITFTSLRPYPRPNLFERYICFKTRASCLKNVLMWIKWIKLFLRFQIRVCLKMPLKILKSVFRWFNLDLKFPEFPNLQTLNKVVYWPLYLHYNQKATLLTRYLRVNSGAEKGRISFVEIFHSSWKFQNWTPPLLTSYCLKT